MRKIDKNLWPITIHKSWINSSGMDRLVSVIIPTYNRGCLLIDALNSVCSQDYRPIEVIIIDDGSTDETKMLITQWVEDHDTLENFTISYLEQPNYGVSSARNMGVIHSHGEYIQYLDSDDLLLPSRLSSCVNVLVENSGIELVHSAFYLDYSDLSEKGLIYTRPAPISKLPDPVSFLWTGAGLFRRSIISEAGPWNEELHVCEDSEYFSRILAIAENICALNAPLVKKRKHKLHRLVDIRETEVGLRDKYTSLLLRERILLFCGIDKVKLINGYLQTAQDSISAGMQKLAIEILVHIKELVLIHPRSLIRWCLLSWTTRLPVGFGKMFWKNVTKIRNRTKWHLDMLAGKLKTVQVDEI